MIPAVPVEDKEIRLPNSCYFSDGKTKVDFVIVLPNFEENVELHRPLQQINLFITKMKEKGLVVEREVGKFYTTLVFLKIHGPHAVLTRYATIYNIGLTCQNPYYKYKETILFNFLTSELTKPDPESNIYKRAQKSLSGDRPTEITTSERSKIIYEILKRITISFDESEVTMKNLLDTDIFVQAYPIHDGDYAWTTEGHLTDRQLLFKFWPSWKYVFKEQPVHLIEKYYGPKIAFYFALASLYTKMLLVPTAIGTITVIVGFALTFGRDHYIENEVCKSSIVLCSDQKLKSACHLMKLAYVIDNPATIVYVILSSFWGVIFWNLWQRRQSMLRLRWNLMGVKADRSMRKDFQQNANVRRSSITGELEYFIPPHKKILTAVFTYLIILIMLLIFFFVVFLVIEYRFVLRKGLDYDEMNLANELELFTSSLLTAILIMILDSCAPYILKMYAQIIKFLTLLRMPRTQLQYNRMYLQMMFIITFSNNFSSLFYLAYVKGFFHKYPGNYSEFFFVRRLQLDLCKPAGCLVDLGMQLITIMIVKTLVKNGFNLIKHWMSPWYQSERPKDTAGNFGQWEKDFMMNEIDDAVINDLYTELVLQYSLITFFNASLPIIGLIALIHNVLKIKLDAYRFLKFYRRPVLEQIPDIQGWNNVLQAVTVFGCISNTFVVAFRSNFIHRTIYENKHNGSLHGYINSTLSKFATSDLHYDEQLREHANETYCYYRGSRYPPEDENQYQPTSLYWQHLAIRALYFIILEKMTLLLSLVLSYLIPEIPRKVKVKLEHDEKMLRAAREAQMEKDKKT
ncbi:hypothetical protein Zmor_027979 [Zophobas morio]|uniref:Anoctamin n=1 Tax=Zophobas morio TaxID=2755281 RepID=A0AA38HRY0_9CUCU|nr:hypothetical protein Zmor_027979 [Zophobas morio]